MTLVDSTVWIDFFRGRDTPQVREFERLVEAGEDICLCGVIVTEVLQGIREDADYERTRACFDAFLFCPMTPQTFVHAAELYRTLRRGGVTIRNTVDCMIAAVALEHDVPLLHNDRDFNPIAEHCGLRVMKTGGKPARAARSRAKQRRSDVPPAGE